jgi:hypothetical protein
MINSKISSDEIEIIDPSIERMLEKVETMYIKKNRNLQTMMNILLTTEQNVLLFDGIRRDNWILVDDYMINHTGKINFFETLQQLLYFFYVRKSITLKQFQNAMGIQQVRWMVDIENPNKVMSGYTVENAEIALWENINESEKNTIYIKIMQYIGKSLYSDISPDFFNNTVWYKVYIGGSQFSSMHQEANVFFGGIQVQKPYLYYPIPETLNLGEMSCMYSPRLIFGTLNTPTITKFILNTNERPFAAHIPDAGTNLVRVHNSLHAIIANWWHDFNHSSKAKCDEAINIRLLNDGCKDDFKVGDKENYDKIIHCLDTHPNLAIKFNDFGFPFKVLLGARPNAEGKTKRKKQKNKKTKKRKKLTNRKKSKFN